MMRLVPRYSIGSNATVEVLDASDRESVRLVAAVRPRASFAQLPGDTLRKLGYKFVEQVEFVLADGSTKSLPIGDVRLRIGDDTRFTTCVSDENSRTPILGMVTLGQFGLEFRPDEESTDNGADDGTTR